MWEKEEDTSKPGDLATMLWSSMAKITALRMWPEVIMLLKLGSRLLLEVGLRMEVRVIEVFFSRS